MCYVPQENIMGVLKMAKILGGSRITYSFNQEELKAAVNDASNFLQ